MMPSWQPNWADVAFDHGAASAATDALGRAARVLDDQARVREQAVRLACEQWRGPRHDEWLNSYHQLRHDCVLLSARLRAHASAIANAGYEATREQRRREEARMLWFRESAAETHLEASVRAQAPIAW